MAAAPAPTLPDLRLPWQAPYDVEGVLGFFARRAVPGIEVVDGDGLRRVLVIGGDGGASPIVGWVAVRFVPEHGVLDARLAPALHGVRDRVASVLRQAFDLDMQPADVDRAMALLPFVPRPGLRLPNGFDGFETAVRVVLGQQITVKAARTVLHRLVDRFGAPVSTPFAELNRSFPAPQTLAAADPADIGTLGIVRQRVRAIQRLAAAVASGEIALHAGAPLAATLDALRAVPGIGEWTAQVIAMRALGSADAWPSTDIGLARALGSRDPARLVALAEPWRPWRSYAVMRLWHAMETDE